MNAHGTKWNFCDTAPHWLDNKNGSIRADSVQKSYTNEFH